MQRPGSESAVFRFSTSALLWPYSQAGGWLKWVLTNPMSLMHLDSADKPAISREKRGCGPSKNRAAPHYVHRERRGEKICRALRCSAPWIFSASACRLLESFHLCRVPTCACGRHAWSPTLHSSIRFPGFRLYTKPHDAVQYQRGKMVSSTLCVSNKMQGTFIFRMPQKGIQGNVTSITYVYLNVEKLPPVLIQHHETKRSLHLCVCVGAWDVVSWFVSAMQVLVWFQGLNTIPFLWEEVCVCALCKACHVQRFTKKVHALKVWISAHLVHGHVQHKR